jgi:hypothetical protein
MSVIMRAISIIVYINLIIYVYIYIQKPLAASSRCVLSVAIAARANNMNKRQNFELAARVPLIFRVPWLADIHTAVSTIVELVDVMPTLAELASLSLPSTEPLPLDGTSLAPLMRPGGPAAADGDAADAVGLTQFPRCVYGIQFGPINKSLPLWALNDCDGIQRSQFSFMGLSMRTVRN